MLSSIKMTFFSIALIAIVNLFVTSCVSENVHDLQGENKIAVKPIEQVQEEHTNDWMAISGVEGTAIGLFEGKPCIKIFSSSKPQQLRDKIPSTVEGYPVIIEETGAFRALD